MNELIHFERIKENAKKIIASLSLAPDSPVKTMQLKEAKEKFDDLLKTAKNLSTHHWVLMPDNKDKSEAISKIEKTYKEYTEDIHNLFNAIK